MAYNLFGGAVAAILVANHGYKLQDWIFNPYILTIMAIHSLIKWKCVPKGQHG